MKIKGKKIPFIVIYIFIIILVILIKFLFLDIKSPDYNTFLSKWFDKIIELRNVDALKHTIGDYPDSYMFILILGTYITRNSVLYIKIVSIIFDFVIFIFGYKIIKNFDKDLAIKKSWILLIIPGIIVNSAVLGQCDSIFSAFILIFIYYILKGKNKLALLFLGISFSFKLQALFVAPILIYLLYTKKIKMFDIIFILIGFIIPFIPSIVYGKGLIENIKILLFQTSEYNYFVKSCPNIYSLFCLNYMEINVILKYILSLIVIIISVIICLNKTSCKYSDKVFLKKLTLLSLIVPFLLPSMHDRYFYLANILIIIYFIIENKNRNTSYLLIILSSIIYVLPVISINFFKELYIDYIVTSLMCSPINLYIVYKMLNE